MSSGSAAIFPSEASICAGVPSNTRPQPQAKSVSPLTYARADVPPVLTIQGDADPIVPYSHGTRLTEALKKAGAKADLFTVPAGGHGNFKPAERTAAYAKIREFLKANGL